MLQNCQTLISRFSTVGNSISFDVACKAASVKGPAFAEPLLAVGILVNLFFPLLYSIMNASFGLRFELTLIGRDPLSRSLDETDEYFFCREL